MTKNYMIEVAKLLGVELEEEFTIPELYDNGYLYKITETGLVCRNRNREGALWQHESTTLKNLLTGELAVTKLPWKPKYGDKYYSYVVGWTIMKCTWMNYVSDYTRLKCGIVFRTSQEALNALPQKYKELTGKEYD